MVVTLQAGYLKAMSQITKQIATLEATLRKWAATDVAKNGLAGFLQTGSPDGAKTNLLQPAACNPIKTY
jgi:hypothetical protein